MKKRGVSQKNKKRHPRKIIPFHKDYTIPLGIRVLSGYLIILFLFFMLYFILGISTPTTYVLGKIIRGADASAFNFAIAVLLAFLVYGYLNRKEWAFEVSVVWFGFGILNAFLSLFLHEGNSFSVLRNISLLSFFITLVVNGLILWYLFSERDYFVVRSYHKKPVQKKDLAFLYSLILIWACVFLVLVGLGLNFYNKTIRLSKATIAELKGSYLEEAQQKCSEKKGQEKDVCYLIMANNPEFDVSDRYQACRSINSDFYKFTCYQSMTQ
ncbi:hypothetical protein D6745_04100 [Candidatus Woesearchaeota archaeon]|nr:MAG: hypothetical protein D6745_04100 [Candidatus Woesearchaeota archaeon]